MMISVIIATYNRNEHLLALLSSIKRQDYSDYEVVVVEQGVGKFSLQAWKDHNKMPKVKYINLRGKMSKSRALNIAVKEAKGSIVAFTDDDCLVGKNWLTRIQKAFTFNPEIVGVFGKTKPYLPEQHEGLRCPSVNDHGTMYIIKNPGKFWENLGSGNNMAFTRETLMKIGKFKEWLGPGSLGVAAEDAEMALRILWTHGKLLYLPDMVVFHNSWLGQDDWQNKQRKYFLGAVICYAYYYFSRCGFAKPVLKEFYFSGIEAFKQQAKTMMGYKDILRDEYWIGWDRIVIFIKGVIIGGIYSILDPLRGVK